MSKSSNSLGEEKFKSKIGGQAVIEGVMMRGIHTASMANRLPNGEIDLETWPIRGGNDLPWYRKVPFIRGVFSFGISLIDGYKCLMRAADKQMTDDGEEEPSRFEKWIEEKLGDKLMPVISFISIVLGLGLAILLFMLVPSLILKLLGKFFEMPMIVKNIIEGILKIAIFIGYTALTGLSKDMRRLYEYHGAEHKTIACYEHGQELTVENVKQHCRFHPRCGTSFVFLVLFISIFVTTIFNLSWSNVLLRVLCKLALLPVVMGISYEIIRLAGKYDNPVMRAVSAPGLWIQRITTKEPEADEIECAIAALKAVIPEGGEDAE
ncbi:MAG: DUF1385 domain-containing protein [Ruminococcus sp.]|nr:DUF1385 domain-containing protein [Ruminococcus sp.]